MSDPVRDAIISVLSGVTDIGMVHSYERYAKRSKDLSEFYVANSQLRGWFVRRLSVKDFEPAVGRLIETTRWQIRGYMSLDDDAFTELIFDDLLDAIRLAFRVDHTLGGVIGTNITEQQAGLSIDDTGPVLFAGVLCHAARGSLITVRYL